MPVRVVVPTRLRLDGEALVSATTSIEEAFAAGALQALASSRETVLDRRGAYVGVRLHPPRVDWFGPGLAEVDEGVRKALEGRLNELLWSAADEAGVLDAALENELLETPLSRPVAEPVQADRLYEAVDLYEVPSYRGRKKKAPVRVVRHRKQPTRLETVFQQLDPKTPEFRRAMVDELARRGRIPPSSGRLGAIYRNAHGQVAFIVATFPSWTIDLSVFLKGDPKVPAVVGSGANAKVDLVPQKLAANVGYRIRWYALGEKEEERRYALMSFWTDAIAEVIRSNAQVMTRLVGHDLDKQIQTRAQQVVDGLVKQLPAETKCFLELTPDGGKPILVWYPAVVAKDMEAELIPLSEQVRAAAAKAEAAPAAAGEGGPGAGAGPGVAAPPAAPEAAGFVYTGKEGKPRAGATRYPSVGEADVNALVCESFEDEPDLSDLSILLPDHADRLRKLMRKVAMSLEMRECAYTATFLLNAADTLNMRAGGVGEYAAKNLTDEGFTRDVPERAGNLGFLQFAPTASPAIQTMRQLATIVPLMTQLRDAMFDAYGQWTHTDLGFWKLHFLEDFNPKMINAIGVLYAMTCRIVLLQLLLSSKTKIELRQKPGYAAIFEQQVLPWIVRVVDVIHLRDRLKHAPLIISPLQQSEMAYGRRHGLTGVVSLGGAIPVDVEAEEGIVRDRHGLKVGITDEQGRQWTMEELEATIVVRRGAVENVEPLVKQLLKLDEVVERFKNTKSIPDELGKLLEEMHKHNEEQTVKVRNDWIYAFNAMRVFRGDLPSATIPGTHFQLQGIHKLAHEQIGEFFDGDPYYVLAIDTVLGARASWQHFVEVVEFTGIVFLAIVQPELAIVVGIGLAFYHLGEAEEKEELYESLIDPDLILSRAEIEAELFARRVGVILSFVPVALEFAPLLGRGAQAVARVGLEATVEEAALTTRAFFAQGVKGVARAVTSRFTAPLLKALEKGIVQVAVTEVVKAELLNELIGKVLEPIMAHVEHEALVTESVGGLEGAERTLMMLGLQPPGGESERVAPRPLILGEEEEEE